MTDKHDHKFIGKIHRSLVGVLLGVCLLFSSAIGVTLIAPRHVDPTWREPSSYYQVQMYDVADPNFYISSESAGVRSLQYVQHLKEGFSLLSFEENASTRILSSPELEKYITKLGDKDLKLTSRLLLLREPAEGMKDRVSQLKKSLQDQAKEEKKTLLDYTVLELYDPKMAEAFSVSYSEGVIEDFVDSNFVIIDEEKRQPWHRDPGVIYVKNPQEYRITPFGIGSQKGYKYDPNGEPVASLDELTGERLGFRSRRELIRLGESIYRLEGCWYCHTMQTRTLVQDVVLNGSESYPAPPSSPNEYIYEETTFPGTRRIGPDLSRTGIKRPSRDWHKAHFWAPKTASAGSIMPSFKHFFDFDPRGTRQSEVGIPNYQFEGIYQYLMVKGTRITAPTKAWWLGKDPVQTLQIIEGRKREER
ncbi:MAG: cbb3-type cytochrome c oxidase subunit II [Chlamydiia bacterium]|nr:cbb3-type cytochrome c oxidase subunit II [Chlamydiia bacterium]